MASADSIVINVLQRATSGDINNLQSLQQRTLLESMRYFLGRSPAGAPFVARDTVLGGMGVSVSATVGAVDVAPGVFMQDSATLSPVPGALDSTYRYARNASTITTTVVGGADGWHLVEAQMVQAPAVMASRQIFNPATNTFSPQTVTVQQDQVASVTTRFGDISNAPAPQAQWVPLAIVRMSGGSVVEVIDVRPFKEDDAPTVANPGAGDLQPIPYYRNRWRTNTVGDGTGTGSSNFFLWDCITANQLGQRLQMTPASATLLISFKSAQWFVAPAFAAPRYLYVSMFSWNGLLPRNAYGGDFASQGVAVIHSAGGPGPLSRVPTGTGLTLPAPFANASPVGTGACVGVLSQVSDPVIAACQMIDGHIVGIEGSEWGGGGAPLSTGASLGDLVAPLHGSLLPPPITGIDVRLSAGAGTTGAPNFANAPDWAYTCFGYSDTSSARIYDNVMFGRDTDPATNAVVTWSGGGTLGARIRGLYM